MLNITQIPAPRVELLDPRTGLMSREWFIFFNNIYTIVGANQGVVQIPNGGTGLSTIPTNGQLLIGDTVNGYVLNTLDVNDGITVTNGAGTITLTNTGVLSFSAGTTGLTPATATNGDVVIGGLLNVASGGTGQSTYTDGQLLIGNTTGNTLTKATLTAGAGINISNGAGVITLANAGVLSFNAGTTGLTPNTATTGAVTLAGTLGTANGGTGLAGTLTGISYMNGTGAHTVATTAQALTLIGTVPIANGGTNSTATPTAGGTVYGTGTAYAISVAGTTGQVLTSAGASAPTWTTPTTGTVTSVTGTAPVVSSGGTTPAISMAAATTSVNGYLTSTDWNTFNNKSNTNGTVTSVAALTLGTTGTDLSSTVATGTTTPVITLQVPTASASNRGALSSTDWSTFNGKYSTGGALGTPSSGTVTNLTGTASININGTVGATTATTGAFTTATANSFIPNLSTIPTNGLYLPAANSVGIATNSTNNVLIDASNFNITASANPTFLIYNSVATNVANTVAYDIRLNTTTSSRVMNRILHGFGNATDATRSSYMVFYTSTGGVLAESMRIDSNGNLSVTGAGTFTGLINPKQATTAGAPAYVKGAIYFDTTLNKLRVGGATAWETISSV